MPLIWETARPPVCPLSLHQTSLPRYSSMGPYGAHHASRNKLVHRTWGTSNHTMGAMKLIMHVNSQSPPS